MAWDEMDEMGWDGMPLSRTYVAPPTHDQKTTVGL